MDAKPTEYAPITLPTIDLSLLSSSKQSTLLDSLSTAASTYGAFYVTAPSFTLSDERAIISATKEVFSLPKEVKESAYYRNGGFVRGYIPIGGESGSERMEMKEAFSYGYDWDKCDLPPSVLSPFSNSLEGHNQWGQLVDILGVKWKNVLIDYYAKMMQITKDCIKALEMAIGRDIQQTDKSGETISMIRLFHYFPHMNDGNMTGSSPHTDWGLLTLVLQPDSPRGLQIYYDNQWWDVPPKPGSFIVNCGDYLSLMTGGAVVSPLHRVVSDGESERYSLVFFYYPHYDTCLPSGQENNLGLSLLMDQSVKHDKTEDQTKNGTEDVTFGEYINRKWNQVARGDYVQ
ncbi:7669_t:CDS:2 [Paraglomus occultum]|uniref:7669_t:CDS:1 n=1 Tax=Paraglomus occultum TaxID=144539 RepID=A0A9N9F8S8_9GLOM|nr:7669_t:CDS:2 [Paraglomus occultum]